MRQADLRSVDSIGRYGGEEFMVILPHTPREEAQRTFGANSTPRIYAWFQTASWIGSTLGTIAVGLLSDLGPGAGFALAYLLGLGLIVSSTRMNLRS